jgi:hypothetical protein
VHFGDTNYNLLFYQINLPLFTNLGNKNVMGGARSMKCRNKTRNSLWYKTVKQRRLFWNTDAYGKIILRLNLDKYIGLQDFKAENIKMTIL